MYFRYFLIISPWKMTGTIYLIKLETTSLSDTLWLVWLKLAYRFWRRLIDFVTEFFPYSVKLYSFGKKGRVQASFELRFPSSFVEIGSSVLEKKSYEFRQCIFAMYIVIISTWERKWPFIWTNLNPIHLRMLCAKLDWNWRSDSGEEFKMKMWQVYRLTDRRTDDVDACDQTSSLEFQLGWAKNCCPWISWQIGVLEWHI